jgi:hypothetical protein
MLYLFGVAAAKVFVLGGAVLEGREFDYWISGIRSRVSGVGYGV